MRKCKNGGYNEKKRKSIVGGTERDTDRERGRERERENVCLESQYSDLRSVINISTELLLCYIKLP